MNTVLNGDIYPQTKEAILRLTKKWVGFGLSARLDTGDVGSGEHLFVPHDTVRSGDLCKSPVLKLYIITGLRLPYAFTTRGLFS